MIDIQEHPVAPPSNRDQNKSPIQMQVFVGLEPGKARVVLHATPNYENHETSRKTSYETRELHHQQRHGRGSAHTSTNIT